MNDPFSKTVFAWQLHPIFHMGGEDEAGHRGREMVMFVFHAPYILNEVKGLFQLPDVVVISADSGQQRIGGNRFGPCLHQASDNDAMVVGARRLEDEVLEKGMLQISQLKQFNIGSIAEKAFNHGSNPQNQD